MIANSLASRPTFSRRRRLTAWLITVLGTPALTWLFVAMDLRLTLETILLFYLVAAVMVGVVGGAVPAAAAAFAGFLLANWFFTPPFRTWRIADENDVLALFAFLVVATAGGIQVGIATRRSAEARRARAQLARDAEAVERMAEIDRVRTALLNAVSHDLRTPLAAIKASVTSLLETGVDWSVTEADAFHRVILEETEKLNRLVGQLLDASRIQSNAVPVFPRPSYVDEVVASAVAGLGARSERVEINVPETLPRVDIDPGLMERVVSNLVENSLNFSPKDRLVRVVGDEKDGQVELRVIDHGPGVPASERETIFQPFQRLSDAAHIGGVGLGLAVARGFLQAMGCFLLVEDTPGGGTTMVIGIKKADTGTRELELHG